MVWFIVTYRIIQSWRGHILDMQNINAKHPSNTKRKTFACIIAAHNMNMNRATKAPLSGTWMYQVDKVNECLDNSLRKTSSSRASSRCSPMRLVERFRICHPGRTCNQIWRCPVCRKYLWNMQHIQLNIAAHYHKSVTSKHHSISDTLSFSFRSSQSLLIKEVIRMRSTFPDCHKN